jgi:hypothetical protein
MAECGFARVGCLCSEIVGLRASGAGAHAMGSRSSQADCGPSVGLRGAAVERSMIAVAPVGAASCLDGRRRTGAGAPCQNNVHRAPSPRSDAQGRWEAARGGGIRTRLRAASRAHSCLSAHAFPLTPFRVRRSAPTHFPLRSHPRPRQTCSTAQRPDTGAAAPAKDGAQVIARQIFARTPLPRMILARAGAAPRCAAIWLRTWPPVVAPVDAAPSPPHDAATRRRS